MENSHELSHFKYSITKDLSYNTRVLMVLGARNLGKSYQAKMFIKRQFEQKGRQFAYIRRLDDEVERTAECYFNDVMINEFPNDEMIYKGGKFILNGKTAGYAFSLAKAKTYKSATYPNIWNGIFEECIPDFAQGGRYLKNEFKRNLGLMSTIFRHNNYRYIMIGNTVSINSPYVSKWRLEPKYPGQTLMRSPDKKQAMLHIVEDDPVFVEFARSTPMGELIAYSDEEDYNLNSNFQMDTDTFIEKKSGNAVHEFNFSFMGENYGCWLDYKRGLYYISDDWNSSGLINYALTTDDMKPNMLIFNHKRSLFRNLLKAYESGLVRFENIRLKGMFQDVFRISV